MEKGISVIICCYNSERIIKRCLQHLFNQKTNPNLKWEIILVNNNCTDNTEKIAKEQFISHPNIKSKIITENKPGLIYARTKGIQNAQYKYILFCDDDNLLCESYIQTAYSIINNDNRIGACGGMGIGEFEILPSPIIQRMQNCYALGSQKMNIAFLYGAGICIRKEIYDQIINNKYPLFLTGRKGNLLLAGDDSEICKWIILMGYKLEASDALTFKHVLPKNRLNITYLKKMLQGFGYAAPILNIYDLNIQHHGILSIHLNFAKSLIALIRSVITYIIRPQSYGDMYFRYCILRGYNYWGYKYLKTTYKQIASIISSKHFKDFNECK